MAGLRNIPVFISDILLAMKVQLAEGSSYGGGVSVLPDNNILISLEQDQGQPPTDDQYVVLVPGPQLPDMDAIEGAAAATITPFNGEVGVIFWARLSVDQTYRDEAYLTDATLSALGTWRRIVKALQLWDATNKNGDYILQEPMRMTAAGFKFRKREPRTGWGNVACSFECKYLADMVSA